jgi:hypothetical protein
MIVFYSQPIKPSSPSEEKSTPAPPAPIASFEVRRVARNPKRD